MSMLSRREHGTEVCHDGSNDLRAWLRQRVEAIIWTLKKQLGLVRHRGRVPAGRWPHIMQRLLALNTCTWHNWMIGAPVKRSLIAYDH
jgi:hypothetical protein